MCQPFTSPCVYIQGGPQKYPKLRRLKLYLSKFYLDVRKTWTSGDLEWMSGDLDVRGPGCPGTWMSGDLDVWDPDVCLSVKEPPGERDRVQEGARQSVKHIPFYFTLETRQHDSYHGEDPGDDGLGREHEAQLLHLQQRWRKINHTM